ncbi:MAG: hypothetical protein B7Z55_04585, partial [Planctomycetales bacterium 12-60-4]
MLLVANLANEWSPTPDEFGHIAGGLLIWQFGHFDLYCVNPPLARALAALPAYLMKPAPGWAGFDYQIQDRPEFRMGRELMASHPGAWPRFLLYGRLLLFAVSVSGAVLCALWARELYGPNAALLALGLWCWSPELLTWNAVIGADGLAATFGLAAGYAFDRWIRHPTWPRASVAGIALSLALLAKTSWLLLIPLWLVLTFMLKRRATLSQVSSHTLSAQLLLLLSLAVYGIHVGYAFEGTLPRLDSLQFFSSPLAGTEALVTGSTTGGNRFRDSWLGAVRLPIPADYVRGIDLQKADFEQGRPSYLCGVWNMHGWWYYYLVGLAVKTPVGVMGLAILAAILAVRRRDHDTNDGAHESKPAFDDQAVLLAPPLALLVMVSACSGFSCHFRYILPALPFLFVWISQAALIAHRLASWHAMLVTALFGAVVVESACAYPHSMSFFNALAGGPARGSEWMLSSSFYWGQDMHDLRRWLDRHAPGEVPFVTLTTRVPPELFEIASRGPCPPAANRAADAGDALVGPVPGLHVIEVEAILDPVGNYSFFQRLRPIAKVGYALHIYRISPAEAFELRSTAGLPGSPIGAESKAADLDRLAENARANHVPRIAIYLSPSDDEAAVIPLQQTCLADFGCSTIDDKGIARGDLDPVDVVIVPGGKASVQASSLGIDGKNRLRGFVSRGGGYVGICAGGFLGSTSFDWGLALANVQCRTDTHYVPRLGYRPWHDRGVGTVRIALTDAGKVILGETPPEFLGDFSGGPVFQP